MDLDHVVQLFAPHLFARIKEKKLIVGLRYLEAIRH